MAQAIHLEDEEFADRLAQAQAMTPMQRLLAGPELFDYACHFTALGIKAQQPGLSDAEVVEVIRDRVQRQAAWERRVAEDGR